MNDNKSNDFTALTDKQEFNDCDKCLTQFDRNGKVIGNALCSEHLKQHTKDVLESLS